MNHRRGFSGFAPLPDPGRPVPGRPQVRRPVFVGYGPPTIPASRQPEGTLYIDLDDHILYVAYRSSGPSGQVEWVRGSCTPTATGGPIESISVNGVDIEPDLDKNVNILVPRSMSDLRKDALAGATATTPLKTMFNELGATVSLPEHTIPLLGELTPLTEIATYQVLLDSIADFVPKSRKVNGHPLTGDITLTKSDLGDFYTDEQIDAKLNGKVGVLRTINGHSLETDIALAASDFDDIYSKDDVDVIIERVTQTDLSWLPKSGPNVFGVVKVDGTTVFCEGGVLSTHQPYSLPVASPSVLGGVRIGAPNTGIDVDAAGNVTLGQGILALPGRVDEYEEDIRAAVDAADRATVVAGAGAARAEACLASSGVDSMSSDVSMTAGYGYTRWAFSDGAEGMIYFTNSTWVLVRGQEVYRTGGLSTDLTVRFQVGQSVVTATRSYGMHYGGFTAEGKFRLDSRGFFIASGGNLVEVSAGAGASSYALPAPASGDPSEVSLVSVPEAKRLAMAEVKAKLRQALSSLDPDASSVAEVIETLKAFASED